MPNYDYECDGCGHTFEMFQQMSEAVKKKCPECKKNKLRRLFGTGAAIMFKGSGFYETDYRSDSYKKAAEKDKKSQSDTTAGGDTAAKTKTDSKPSGESKSESPKSSGGSDSSSSGGSDSAGSGASTKSSD